MISPRQLNFFSASLKGTNRHPSSGEAQISGIGRHFSRLTGTMRNHNGNAAESTRRARTEWSGWAGFQIRRGHGKNQRKTGSLADAGFNSNPAAVVLHDGLASG